MRNDVLSSRPERRRSAGRILRSVAARLPVNALVRLTGLRVLVPFFHIVTDAPPPYMTPPSYRFAGVDDFERKLDYLLRHFAPLNLNEFRDALRGNRKPARPGFHLTFDDGHREMSDIVAPMLLRKGVSATFFVCSDFIDGRRLFVEHKATLVRRHSALATAEQQRAVQEVFGRRGLAEPGAGLDPYGAEAALDEAGALLGLDWDRVLAEYRPYLSEAQLRTLVAQGFTVGAHSVDHPRYRTLPLREQLRQTEISMNAVCRRLRLSYRAFALPYSDLGIPREFFEAVFRRGIVDILFCTRELMEDEFADRCVHRLWIETAADAGDGYLREHLARKLVRQLRGTDRVRRAD